MTAFPFAVVCITGGTGTLGTALAAHLHATYPDVHLRILSRDEFKQDILRSSLGEDHVSYLLGDVRDVDRLRLAFKGVDLVIHAAALKQVPALEYNPVEGVMTNVEGSRNVFRAALDCGVKHTLLISSDKAVHSQTLYGSTKYVAERLFIQANSYSPGGETRYSVVRYGNVVTSRGSAINFFQDRLRQGMLLPLTDQRMTRFWMEPDEAVRLVLFAAEHANRGEIMVPELPAFAVMDLLRAILGKQEGESFRVGELEVVGRRPGEKIHEDLLADDEIERTYLSEQTMLPFSVYSVSPTYHSWEKEDYRGRIPFLRASYNSETWPIRLTVADIRERLLAMGRMA